MIDPTILDRLDALERAATPAPWEVVSEIVAGWRWAYCRRSENDLSMFEGYDVSAIELAAELRNHCRDLLTTARDGEYYRAKLATVLGLSPHARWPEIVVYVGMAEAPDLKARLAGSECAYAVMSRLVEDYKAVLRRFVRRLGPHGNPEMEDMGVIMRDARELLEKP